MAVQAAKVVSSKGDQADSADLVLEMTRENQYCEETTMS